ncbi:hypothetical protein SDJN02_12589, partial [Cucurbita argyrosperma subsp. argyrosperma]
MSLKSSSDEPSPLAGSSTAEEVLKSKVIRTNSHRPAFLKPLDGREELPRQEEPEAEESQSSITLPNSTLSSF